MIAILKAVAMAIIQKFPYDLEKFSGHKLKSFDIADDVAYLKFKVKGKKKTFDLEIFGTVDGLELCIYQPDTDFLHALPMPHNLETERLAGGDFVAVLRKLNSSSVNSIS